MPRGMIWTFLGHFRTPFSPRKSGFFQRKGRKRVKEWREVTFMKEWVKALYIGYHQDWNRVLVSLISWPGQLLSLFLCERLKFLARMLFLGILSWTVVRMCWFRKSLPRSIYSISILLLEFIFPFVRPSEYIIIPEVCAQGWYSSSTPVLFVEFGSFFLTFFFILSSHFCTFLANLRFFCRI